MLEAVFLAPSAARGHEVVCPPAAERERRSNPGARAGSASLALGPADKLAPLRAKRPDLGDLAQRETVRLLLEGAGFHSTKSSSGTMDRKRGPRNF